MMQQHIHIEPLLADDGRSYAVVTVIDVTDEVLRSSVLAELAQKLEHDSNRDPLTGLYNRRFMWEWLLQQLRLCSRTQHRLSCLMVDLDYFKKVNDRYGHDVGDRILKQFSEVIASQLRDADILVRYGGEEFAAFLPDCDMAQAMSTGWRFINILKHSQLTPLEKGSMTCSVGVATFHPEDPLTGEELLRLADQRLYKAKNSGRNRVVGDA
jgi:diguanylate cyclase (GGDEF)-like protein